MKNSSDNVFRNIPAKEEEADLFGQFLDANDFSELTRKAFTLDIRKYLREEQGDILSGEEAISESTRVIHNLYFAE